jgi:TolC family type I secretion outer membrane protein
MQVTFMHPLHARRGAMRGLAVAAALMLAPTAAQAQSLPDALALTYDTNPTLAAERARVRAQDESFVQARSSALPSVTGNISVGTSDTERSGDPDFGAFLPLNSTSDTISYSLSATQNLFRGGRTGAAMDQALANILSARAQLLSTEQNVLLSAVSAFMDVRRDEAILVIRANNVQVLERQLQASRDRFEVGEITRTDVSQAEARLAGARSEYAAAQAALATSRATYEQVVGQAPGTLEPEPPLPALPATLEEAWELAMDANPDVMAAAFSEEAAQASVRGAKGAMLPTVSVSTTAQHQRSFNPSGPFDFSEETELSTWNEGISVQGRVSVPLFSGNALSSSLRQARQSESGARLQLRDAERRAREAVSTAWSAYLASLSQTASSAEQVRANELAYEGVEAEAAVGLRTTLDVLNAEQELLNARLALVQAQRNGYVAGFRVLQSIGAVNALNLNLDVELYDPAVNLSSVRRRYLGIGLLE